MGRSDIVGWAGVVFLCVASGCGTFSRLSSTDWYHNVDRGRKAAADQFARHNPFRQNTDEFDGDGTGRRSGSSGNSKSADNQFARHDPNTQQLIDDELADASPQEREQLTADLNGLEPALIRQILKLRRMRIQMEQEHREMAGNGPPDPNRPLPGLGAPFPGSERRDTGFPADSNSFADHYRQSGDATATATAWEERDAPRSSQAVPPGQVRLASGESTSQGSSGISGMTNGGDFRFSGRDNGHLQSGPPNRSAAQSEFGPSGSGQSFNSQNADRRHEAPPNGQRFAPTNAGQLYSQTSGAARHQFPPPDASRGFAGNPAYDPNRDPNYDPASRTIDRAFPGEVRPVINAGHVPPAENSQRFGPPTSTTGFIQTGATSIPAGQTNPLQMSGIETGPPVGMRTNNGPPSSFASNQYPSQRFSEGPGMSGGTGLYAAGQSSIQWDDSLRRLIVVAEERAQAAQTAWEQAERTPPAGAADAPARQQFIAARKQDYVRQQVYLRMLYLMSGQQARSLERILGLEPAEQEFWTQMLWSMANYFDYEGIPNEQDRATQTVAQLRSAVQQLQENARLEVRNVNFCRKISSFGNFEPFAGDTFRPKQPVLIYAEIENFASERGSDGMYRTLLQSTVEIHTAGGQVVQRIQFDPTTDLCRNHRHDYFHSYEIQIPAEATGGPYVLTLLVEDKLSKRVASYSRNFTVE